METAKERRKSLPDPSKTHWHANSIFSPLWKTPFLTHKSRRCALLFHHSQNGMKNAFKFGTHWRRAKAIRSRKHKEASREKRRRRDWADRQKTSFFKRRKILRSFFLSAAKLKGPTELALFFFILLSWVPFYSIEYCDDPEGFGHFASYLWSEIS